MSEQRMELFSLELVVKVAVPNVWVIILDIFGPVMAVPGHS